MNNQLAQVEAQRAARREERLREEAERQANDDLRRYFERR
jgi:hypothetical protein